MHNASTAVGTLRTKAIGTSRNCKESATKGHMLLAGLFRPSGCPEALRNFRLKFLRQPKLSCGSQAERGYVRVGRQKRSRKRPEPQIFRAKVRARTEVSSSTCSALAPSAVSCHVLWNCSQRSCKGTKSPAHHRQPRTGLATQHGTIDDKAELAQASEH
jgi:hypothetical protein